MPSRNIGDDFLLLPDDLSVAIASWVNTPFAWGASVQNVGCDCAGLIAGIGKQTGRIEQGWTCPNYGRGVDPSVVFEQLDFWFSPSFQDAPGEILILRTRQTDAIHLAILLGTDEHGREYIAHASERAGRVILEPIAPYYAIVERLAWKYPYLAFSGDID